MEGFVNIDKAELVDPDMIVDIEEGLPFKDNVAEHIYSSHCLEHVRPDKWQFVLDEVMRVAKDGCILELELPFDNTRKRCNIGHYRTFYFTSWTQYHKKERKRAYYSRWKLIPLNKFNMFEIIFFTLFPILKPSIYFKFMVSK